MPRKPVEVCLQWRDESYGSVSADSAFRTFIDPDVSDSMYEKICRKFRKHGFQINHSRAAWIAGNPKPNYLTNLVAELEGIGCAVKHEGHLPAGLRARETVQDGNPSVEPAPVPKM